MKLWCFILLCLTIIGCRNSVEKEKHLLEVEFGKLEYESDSLGVELELDQFEIWNDLVNRTEEIVCNDSLPKITLKSGNKIKKIYFWNPCWKDYDCILIRERNVIEIHNDTINKSDMNSYPLDSLESVMRRDIENNGRNQYLCDHPDRLLFSISYNNKHMEHLAETLDKLTETYTQLTNKTNIKIILAQKIYSVPELPSPEEVDERN